MATTSTGRDHFPSKSLLRPAACLAHHAHLVQAMSPALRDWLYPEPGWSTTVPHFFVLGRRFPDADRTHETDEITYAGTEMEYWRSSVGLIASTPGPTMGYISDYNVARTAKMAERFMGELGMLDIQR